MIEQKGDPWFIILNGDMCTMFFCFLAEECFLTEECLWSWLMCEDIFLSARFLPLFCVKAFLSGFKKTILHFLQKLWALWAKA